MAPCIELAVQLPGLQGQLSDLQSQLSDLEYQRTHPNEACADQGLTGTECQQYLRGLGNQIRSTQSQISGVQSQIAGIQQNLTAQGCPTDPIAGADGANITVHMDALGHLVAAEAIGNDGVQRSLKRTLTYEQDQRSGWYYGVVRQEFFENDQRYLYTTEWSYLWARKLANTIVAGDTVWGLSINFPEDGSQDVAPITIYTGKFGQIGTTTMGQLNLNQGSLAAPLYTGDFTLPAEIQQQLGKVSYFRQLNDFEVKQYQAQRDSVLQSAGVSVNMTLNQILYGPTMRQATVQPFAGGGGGERGGWGKVAAIVGCWVVGGLITAVGSTGPVQRLVAGGLGGAFGAYCNELVNRNWPGEGQIPQPPPNNPDMTAMPPDASVPVDLGSDSLSGGGGTTCVPPYGTEEIILPPLGGGTANTVVPFEELGPSCL